MASILGREFEFETLLRATAIPEEGLISALEAAQQAQLIHEARRNGDIVFSFDHALIPASLADSVSALRRKRLHRLAAGAIEADRPEAWEVLAFHWIQAGEDELGRVCSLRAADRAYASLARSEAVRHYRAALERWPAGDPVGRADTLAKLGDCLLLITDPGAYDVYREARDLFRQFGDPTQTGEMERRIGRFFWEAGNRTRAMEHYSEALRLLQGGPPTPELARAMSSMSQMHMLASEYDQAIAWGERALELGASIGAEDVQVHALNNLGASHAGMGDGEKGMALLQESLDRALRAGLPHDAARAYANLGDMSYESANYKAAERWHQAGNEFARRYQLQGFVAFSMWSLARLAWTRGDWSEARHRLHEIESVGIGLGIVDVAAPALNAQIAVDLGRPGEALDYLEANAHVVEHNEEPQSRFPHLIQTVHAAAEVGDPQRGTKAVEGLVGAIDAAPTFSSFAGPALFAILQWLRAGGTSPTATAAECLTRLERLDAQQHTSVTAAYRASGRAVVAAMDGRWAEAAAALEEAVPAWAKLERPFDQAGALLDHADVLVSSGDPSKARVSLTAAKEILQSLSAQLDDPADAQSFAHSRLVTRVDELLRQV
jgi:tetratricopeptide (TPR) repeat protein